jgi:hypothetical protein
MPNVSMTVKDIETINKSDYPLELIRLTIFIGLMCKIIAAITCESEKVV